MINSLNTPRYLGYRMPAEWEQHSDSWLVWPSTQQGFSQITLTQLEDIILQLAKYISNGERVNLLLPFSAKNHALERIQNFGLGGHLIVQIMETDSLWIRHFGGNFLLRKTIKGYPNPRKERDYEYEYPDLALNKWKYRAFGLPLPWESDDQVFHTLTRNTSHVLNKFETGLAMSPANVEVNGQGVALSSLGPFQQIGLEKEVATEFLKAYLNVNSVFWFEGEPHAQDKTGGVIENIARFVSPVHILLAECPGSRQLLNALKTEGESFNFKITTIPVPAFAGSSGSASYLNFYIANDNVILPDYGSVEDNKMMNEIMTEAFPFRKVTSFDCREILTGMGSLRDLICSQPQVF